MTDREINKTIPKRPDDISIRGLILKIKENIFLVLRKWWIVGIFLIGFGAYDYFETNKAIPVYPGKTVLLVKLQDLAKENKSKILVYSRFANAQSIVKKILLKPIVEDSSRLLINVYLDTYFKLNPSGLPAFIPSGFKFQHGNYADFSDKESLVFKSIVNKMITPIAGYADGFINVSVNESLGMITLAIATPSEALTIAIIDSLRENLVEQTLDNAIYPEKMAYTTFKQDADSLEQKYKETYYRLLKVRNQYGNILLMKEDSLSPKIKSLQQQIARLEVNADIFKINYLATIESLKFSQNKLNLKLPIIEVLEQTMPPISANKPSAVTAAIKGGFLGSLLAMFLIIVVNVFLDILKEEEMMEEN
ncbi:hypothetical protein OAF63_02580 [Saprospiraceae bacterium]|nr:hypothetical protein [Saprospiraceae bacterium]